MSKSSDKLRRFRQGTIKQRRERRKARAESGTSNRLIVWGIGEVGSRSQSRENMQLLKRAVRGWSKGPDKDLGV